MFLDSLATQTLLWFNPDPGKIFDDQYSYSSVCYSIISLVFLCRHPYSSNSVFWSQIFISGCSLWYPVYGIPNSLVYYLPLWPKLLHSKENANVDLFTARALGWTGALLSMCITACLCLCFLWLLLAVTWGGGLPKISFLSPRFRTGMPFYFPLHTVALWSIWSLFAIV